MFTFCFTAEEVYDYRAAAGFDDTDAVPVAFAAKAVMLPEVRAAVAEALGGRAVVLIAQSVESHAVLRPCVDYSFRFDIAVLDGGRVRLDGSLMSPDGELCMELQSEAVLLEARA